MNPRTVRPLALHRPSLRVDRTPNVDADGATLYLYDAIDSWGGDWGVSASDVRAALTEIGSAAVELHINSPGGDYFEAVAIYNTLQAHAGAITVHIDGLAASAASVIAMVGERVIMGQGSQLMIHDALTMAFGNAGEIRKTADLLDQCSDDISGFYARRAGGDPAAFREAMRAETWYTADQAVAAGLADEVAGAAPTPAVAASAERWIAALRPAPLAPEPGPIPDLRPTAVVPPPAALPTTGPNLAELIRSAVRKDHA